jgi:hypothetical protein
MRCLTFCSVVFKGNGAPCDVNALTPDPTGACGYWAGNNTSAGFIGAAVNVDGMSPTAPKLNEGTVGVPVCLAAATAALLDPLRKASV